MSALEFRQFICRACGLVYDEAQGDPDSGLAPGTRFEDIPDDWACPLCGVTKQDFEALLPNATGIGKRTASAGNAPSADADRQASANGKPGRAHARITSLIRGSDSAGLVIVGGGTAGWALAEQVRARDATRPITLISACSADRYDKPRLSVALHQGLAASALPKERAVASAARLGVTLWAHTHAAGVDLVSKQLRTTRGTIRFNDLALAYGAIARACDGLPDAITWRINDLGSYTGLRHALEAMPASRDRKATDVLIVGAGLVGCELANDLALAGYSVVLLEGADRPLPMASLEQSKALLKAWQGLPLRFVGQVQVQEAHSVDGQLKRVRTADGQCFETSILICAVGLTTAPRLARQAGLRWDNGIAVDASTLDTGVRHVHALGDCISIAGRAQRFIEPIHRQARLIADRICGLPTQQYDARPPAVRVKTTSLPLSLAA